MTSTYVETHLEILRRRRARRFIWHCFMPFPVKESDTEIFDELIEDWLYRLIFLRCSGEATASMAKDFAEYLVANQRTADDNRDRVRCAGSWTIPEDVVMGDSDLRVDYMYFPTYIAVSVLSLIRQDFTEIADEIDGFDAALKSGLDFASGRDLQGHGYEGVADSLRAIEYLALGKVFSLFRGKPKESFKFLRAKGKAKKQIEKKLENNVGWSSVDEDQALVSLSILQGADKYTCAVCKRPKIIEIKMKVEAKEERPIEEIEREPVNDIEEEAVEEILLTLAADMTRPIIEEIVSRKKEIDIIADNMRPKNPAYKNMRKRIYSENIKLNASYRIQDVVKNIESDEFYRDLKITKEFMNRLSESVKARLHEYFDSRDINGENVNDNDIFIKIVDFELDKGRVYPVMSVGVY